jgi:hypothetical protein
MKITDAEIEAALKAFCGVEMPSYRRDMKAALEAAYRVRKARKKAAREAKLPSADDVRGIMSDANQQAAIEKVAREREAALRKLGSAIAREFPGVSG